MKRSQILGAVRLPAIFFLWSAALVLFVSEYHAADAAVVRTGPAAFVVPPATPRLADPAALERALHQALQAADVGSGRWQPRPPGASAFGRSAPARSARERDAFAEPVAAQPAALPSAKLPETDSASDMSAAASFVKAPARPAEPAAGKPLDVAKRDARSALRAGSTRHAYGLLMQRVAAGRDDAEFLGLLAVASLGEQRFAEARVVYEKLVLLQPGNDRWWAGLALSQQRLGENADGSFRRVAELASAGSELERLTARELRST